MRTSRETAGISRFGIVGLDVGTVGRAVRLVTGAAIAIGVIYRLWIDSPPAAFLTAVALYFLATLVVYGAAHLLLGKRLLARANPWIGTAIILGPVLVVWALHIGPPAFQLGLRLYVGVSLIVSAFMAYGGCEVVAIPSLLFGKRYVVYCPYNAIDLAEKAAVDRRRNA